MTAFLFSRHATRLAPIIMGGLVALALTGCQTTQTHGFAEAIPADAMKRPVDMSVVCFIHNDEIQSEVLVKSLVTGVTRFGSLPRLLEPGEGPQACSFVVDYRIDNDGVVMTAIRFQTFENSIPGIQASGRTGQGGALTFDNVAEYTLQLLTQSQKRLDQRAQVAIKDESQIVKAGAKADQP